MEKIKMTMKKAEIFYNISKLVDPFGVCDLDKDDIINNLMTNTFEANVQDMEKYLSDYCDVEEIVGNKALLKLLADLYEPNEDVIYQVIFSQGDYSHVDYETESYEQACEVMRELQNEMYFGGERGFDYIIKEIVKKGA